MTVDEALEALKAIADEMRATNVGTMDAGTVDALVRFGWPGRIEDLLAALVQSSRQDEALARIAALERKNDTLRNAWQTSEADRLTTVTRVAELEREVARLTDGATQARTDEVLEAIGKLADAQYARIAELEREVARLTAARKCATCGGPLTCSRHPF